LQRLSLQNPSFEYIRKILELLYSSQFIPEGEGAEIRIDFFPLKWAKKYGLNTYAMMNALKILEKEGILLIENSKGGEVYFKVLPAPYQVREYIETFAGKSPAAAILEKIIRSYMDVFDYPVKANWDVLSEKWEVEKEKLMKIMQTLHAHGWIELRSPESTMQLVFLRNRDDAALNMHRKRIESHLQISRQKAFKILQYVENTTRCRVDFIKEYLGEPEGFICGKCDVCVKNSGRGADLKSRTVWEFIKANGLVSYHDLVRYFGQGNHLDTLIRELVEDGKIKIDENRNLKAL
jgi:ATP-dependent DNA helicase RecQ